MPPSILDSSRYGNRTISFSIAVVLVFIIGLVTLTPPDSRMWTPDFDASGSVHVDDPNPALSDILKQNTSLSTEQYLNFVTRPLVKIDQKKYSVYGAQNWKLPESHKNWTWTEPLGDQLCIIDIDNRSFNESGQIWGDEAMSWKHTSRVHGLSLGMLNHWLYAKIHGYKYYFIDIDEYPDRRASWKKPLIMSELLKNHTTCIYLDSDAVFHHLDLPFEWLMNYWSIDPKSNSLALAEDPDRPYNMDNFENLYLNTGFIVAQNNTRTFEVLKDWRECADDGGKHPDCTEFRLNQPGRPTDQGGFGNFIRYDYPRDIKTLPCDEANGYTQSDSDCHGQFIQHLWTGKDSWIKLVVGRQMPGKLLETFHRNFLKEKPEFWMTEKMLLSKNQ